MVGNACVTMREVAREARVSIGTVSNVLAGRNVVSAELKERVEAAVAQTGYRRNGIAASLRRRRSRTIGVCIPDLGNPFFHGLAQALSWQLEEDGYDALLIETNESGLRNESKLQTLYSKQVEGVFLVPAPDWNGEYDGSIPHVILDRVRQAEPLPSIALDNAGTTSHGVDRLHALGHRHMWLVMNSSRLWNSAQRRAGFLSACRRHGVERACRVVEGGMSGHEIAEAVQIKLEAEGPPSAIIAGHGSATLGTLRALHTLGISVPETTSILAFDDIAWMEVLRPSISVIVQPFEEMARLGWIAMKDAIAGQSIEGINIRLKGSLIERESTVAFSQTSQGDGP